MLALRRVVHDIDDHGYRGTGDGTPEPIHYGNDFGPDHSGAMNSQTTITTLKLKPLLIRDIGNWLSSQGQSVMVPLPNFRILPAFP